MRLLFAWILAYVCRRGVFGGGGVSGAFGRARTTWRLLRLRILLTVLETVGACDLTRGRGRRRGVLARTGPLLPIGLQSECDQG